MLVRVGEVNLGRAGWSGNFAWAVALIEAGAYDIVVVTEVHAREGEALRTRSDRVSVHYNARQRAGARGGVAVLVRRSSGVPAPRVVDAGAVTDWLVVRVQWPGVAQPLFVGAAYLAPPTPLGDGCGTTEHTSRAAFESLLVAAGRHAHEGLVVVLGDVNAHIDPDVLRTHEPRDVARVALPVANPRGRHLVEACDDAVPAFSVLGPAEPTYWPPAPCVPAALDVAFAPTAQRAQLSGVAVDAQSRDWTDHALIHVTVALPARVPLAAAAPRTRVTRRCRIPRHRYIHVYDPRWKKYRDRVLHALADGSPREGETESSEAMALRFEKVMEEASHAAAIAQDRGGPLHLTAKWAQSLRGMAKRLRRAQARLRAAERSGAAAAYIEERSAQCRELRLMVRRYVRRRAAAMERREMRMALRLRPRERHRLHRWVQTNVLRSDRGGAGLARSVGDSNEQAVRVWAGQLARLYAVPAEARDAANLPADISDAALETECEALAQRAMELTARGIRGPLDATVTCIEARDARRALPRVSSTSGPLPMADVVNTGPPLVRPAPVDTYLAELLTALLQRGPFPKHLREALGVPLHKKGDATDPANYRVLGIGSGLARLFQQLLLHRLQRWATQERLLTDEQAGFRPMRGTEYHLLLSAAACADAAYRREHLHCLYVDISRAFASAHHNLLLVRLWHLGLRGQAWLRLYEMYRDMSLYVVFGECASVPVRLRRGTAEGNAMSPLLYILYIQPIIDAVKGLEGVVGVDVPGWGELRITAYADDLKVYVSDAAAIPRVVAAIESVANELRVKFNLSAGKTESMLLRPPYTRRRRARPSGGWWRMYGEEVRATDSYKYLGLAESRDGHNATCQSARRRAQAAVPRARGQMLAAGLPKKSVWLGLHTWMQYILPRFDYASGVWAPDVCPRSLSTFQHLVGRLILNVPKGHQLPMPVVSAVLGWPSLLGGWRRARLRLFLMMLSRPVDDLLRLAMRNSLVQLRSMEPADPRRQEFWWVQTLALLRRLGYLSLADWFLDVSDPVHGCGAVDERRLGPIRDELEERLRDLEMAEWESACASLSSLVHIVPYLRRMLAGRPARRPAWGSSVAAVASQRDGERRVPAHSQTAHFLHDTGYPAGSEALRATALGGWHAFWGAVPRARRTCPLCAAGAALTVPHVLRDCPALEGTRAACWAATRAKLWPPQGEVMPAALPPMGSPLRELLVHLALGVAPPALLPAPPRPPHIRRLPRGAPRSAARHLFAPMRAAAPLLRKAHDAVDAMLPPLSVRFQECAAEHVAERVARPPGRPAGDNAGPASPLLALRVGASPVEPPCSLGPAVPAAPLRRADCAPLRHARAASAPVPGCWAGQRSGARRAGSD